MMRYGPDSASRGMLLALIAICASAAASERRELGQLVLDGIPDIPDSVHERMVQYLSGREAVFMDWSPHGQILISTRFGDTPQIHRVAEPMGARQQLTFFGEPVTFARYSPNPRASGFAFFKDVGGDENYQLYFYDTGRGQHRLLTDGQSRNGFAVWSNDGRRLAYYSNQRNGTNWDIYVTRPDGRSRLVVKSTAGAWAPLDWSREDDKLLVWHYVSIDESALYVADLLDGRIRQVGRDGDLVGISAAAFARDGRGVFVASDRDAEYRHLRYVDLRSGREELLTGDMPWDVEQLDPSPDGRYLAYTLNDGGIGRLRIRDLKFSRELAVPELPAGPIHNLAFDRDGRRLGMTIETALSPRDAYVYDLETTRLERWTRSETGGLPTELFVAPEQFDYPTFDRLEDGTPRPIPAFAYRPRGTGPHPVLLHLHGGPESQFRPGFEPTFQFFVNELGFAVIAPNVRGSAGYGRSYLQLDNGRRREDAVRDVGALLDWIALQPELDAGRVVVSGASYGGYLTLAAMAAYGERLLGGVDVVGITNFVTFLENTSEYRRDLRRQEYGDERDPDMRAFLADISPITRAQRIDKPLLIVQGLNDPRVPPSESEQMVETIRGMGGTVWYLLARDEGHGFRKKSNREIYYSTMAAFLRSLLEAGNPDAAGAAR